MPPQPLTHHEILGLVEPFTRHGRHLDLAASNRLERRLLFKPIDHVDGLDGLPAMREVLQLDCRGSDLFRLTRRLTLSDGLQASLEIEGPQPDKLLAHIEAVPRPRQVMAGSGFTMAVSHRLEVADPEATPEMLLTQGQALVDGLTFTLRAATVQGYPADIELLAAPGDPIALPEDLLAVLGWDWTRLIADKERWTSKLRIRGKEPLRSRRAETQLQCAARHLAAVLAEPPCHFHEQRIAARWKVVFRRAIPLLTSVAMIIAALAASKLPLAEHSPIRLLLFNSPTILMALAFLMQELPRLEIPPLPRRSRASAWRTPAPVNAAAA